MKRSKRKFLTIFLILFFLFPSASFSQDKNLAYDFVKAATNGKIEEVKTLFLAVEVEKTEDILEITGALQKHRPKIFGDLISPIHPKAVA